MSMMMPPQAQPPDLGPGPAPIPDRGVMPQGPIPGQGGLGALSDVLAPGQGGPPAESMGLPGGASDQDQGSPIDGLDAIDLIKEAMKLLMVALAKSNDEEHGVGITKGMGALQGILGGQQKKQAQLGALTSGPSA